MRRGYFKAYKHALAKASSYTVPFPGTNQKLLNLLSVHWFCMQASSLLQVSSTKEYNRQPVIVPVDVEINFLGA